MKTRKLLISIILLSTSLLLFAVDKITIDQTYGTWVNSDYNYSGQNAKITITPEGIVEEYNKDTDEDPIYRSKRTITDRWQGCSTRS